MILAIDTGLRTLGWSLLSSRGRIHALGALVLDGVEGETVHDGYVRRLEMQIDLIASRPAVDLVVAEGLSFARSAKQVASVSLCWGSLVALCRSSRLPLVAVPPKEWQRALINSKGKVDQRELARRIDRHVRQTALPAAVRQLDELNAASRPHALDAAGIGTYYTTCRRPCG